MKEEGPSAFLKVRLYLKLLFLHKFNYKKFECLRTHLFMLLEPSTSCTKSKGYPLDYNLITMFPTNTCATLYLSMALHWSGSF